MLEGDSDILGDLYKNCKDAKEKIRYTALYAVSRGNDVKTVANIVAVEESTIYDWIKKWIIEERVADKPRSGRPPKLTKKDEEEIRRLIEENDPKKHGINASSYTTKELQEYFIKFRSKYIDEETLRIHLKSTGARYVKAVLRYKEADENKQIEFARNFYDLVVNYGFTKILFIDEMSVSTSAHNGYGWTFNQRLIIDAPQSKKDHANYFGAVEVRDGEITEIVRKSAKVGSFIALLKKIESRYTDEKMLICMDNGRVHHAETVSRFFRSRRNMKLLFLPPYSPDINPEEYVHNYLRDKLLDNRNFKSIKQIGRTISEFVKRMNPESVRSIAPLAPIEALLSVQNEL
jgi:putative transposase